MRYIAAYMLAVMGGKHSPNSNDIKHILSCVGIDVDDEKLQKVVKELRGKNLQELIAVGREKLATLPSGGGETVPVTLPEVPVIVEEKIEPKKEVKKEESSSESDDDMGFGLFD